MYENITIMRAILINTLLVYGLAVSPVSAATIRTVRELAGEEVECGKPVGQTRQGRIMGGKATDIDLYPYAVSFQNSSGYHFCSGSLVILFFFFSKKQTIPPLLARVQIANNKCVAFLMVGLYSAQGHDFKAIYKASY